LLLLGQDYVQYRCDEDIVRHCFEKNTPIPSTYYAQFLVSISTCRAIVADFPSLYDVLTCGFVRAAFRSLTGGHCGRLQSALDALWIGFASAATAIGSLQFLWAAIGRRLPAKNSGASFGFTSYSFIGLP
jgi:hypothetical protein